MKKILFAVVVLVALMFCTTSCNPDKKRCYKVTVTYKVEGEEGTKEASAYKWQSALDGAAEAMANALLKGLGLDPTKVTVVKTESEYLKKYKTEEDCLAQNPAK